MIEKCTSKVTSTEQMLRWLRLNTRIALFIDRRVKTREKKEGSKVPKNSLGLEKHGKFGLAFLFPSK